MNFGRFSNSAVCFFISIDSNSHDYRLISSMHIDRSIAGIRFWFCLIFFVPFLLSFFSHSCAIFYFIAFSLLFVVFLAFFLLKFFCWIFLYISRSMSEQPQCRYNLHKTLQPSEVSMKFEIYSHWVYRYRAKDRLS